MMILFYILKIYAYDYNYICNIKYQNILSLTYPLRAYDN